MISKGNLPPALNAAAAATDTGNIQFTRADNTGTGTSKKNDKAILVAYFPATNEVVYSFGAGTRASGNAVLETVNWKGQAAETWMGYLSDDEKDAACSVYTGSACCKYFTENSKRLYSTKMICVPACLRHSQDKEPL